MTAGGAGAAAGQTPLVIPRTAVGASDLPARSMTGPSGRPPEWFRWPRKTKERRPVGRVSPGSAPVARIGGGRAPILPLSFRDHHRRRQRNRPCRRAARWGCRCFGCEKSSARSWSRPDAGRRSPSSAGPGEMKRRTLAAPSGRRRAAGRCRTGRSRPRFRALSPMPVRTPQTSGVVAPDALRAVRRGFDPRLAAPATVRARRPWRGGDHHEFPAPEAVTARSSQRCDVDVARASPRTSGRPVRRRSLLPKPPRSSAVAPG